MILVIVTMAAVDLSPTGCRPKGLCVELHNNLQRSFSSTEAQNQQMNHSNSPDNLESLNTF